MDNFHMGVEIIGEYGYQQALIGLSLNHNQPINKMPAIAERLCHHDGGHNKLLESIGVWLLVTAPRYWWQQADTYRIATKQSESTMHTILKSPLTASNFEEGGVSESYLAELNEMVNKKEFFKLKKRLPESFLQTREWYMSYKTLRNIFIQRCQHKLGHWKSFARQVLMLVQHPELLPAIEKDMEKNLPAILDGEHVMSGTRVVMGGTKWSVVRMYPNGEVLLMSLDGGRPYNMVIQEKYVLNESLF